MLLYLNPRNKYTVGSPGTNIFVALRSEFRLHVLCEGNEMYCITVQTVILSFILSALFTEHIE